MTCPRTCSRWSPAEASRRSLDNIDTVRGAAEALDFASARFDAVVSRYSAHHWQTPGQRCQGSPPRPEGRRPLAIFIDVIAPEQTLHDTWLQSVELLRDPSHVRDMTLSEWKQVIEAAGMAIEETVVGRLRLAFDPWIERLKTPPSPCRRHSLIAAWCRLQRRPAFRHRGRWQLYGRYGPDCRAADGEVRRRLISRRYARSGRSHSETFPGPPTRPTRPGN